MSTELIQTHKAEPIDQTSPSLCKHCRGTITKVPGGHGPMWVHEDGYVVGHGAPLAFADPQAEADNYLRGLIHQIDTSDPEAIGDGTGTYDDGVGKAERYMVCGNGPTAYLYFIFDDDGDIDHAYLEFSTGDGRTVHSLVSSHKYSALLIACRADANERKKHG